jgi:hypothetical protein
MKQLVPLPHSVTHDTNTLSYNLSSLLSLLHKGQQAYDITPVCPTLITSQSMYPHKTL